jgi:hypothetical protein
VVKNCLMVLTHLILNDMMKVRSHISQLALRLQDDDARIAALAQLFFHELSRKAFKVAPSPIGAPPVHLAGCRLEGGVLWFSRRAPRLCRPPLLLSRAR